jgi:septum site-determining protein MinC
MNRKTIEFKGTKEGIILQMDYECEFEEIFEGLAKKVAQGKNFFSGARIIGTEGRTLTKREKDRVAAFFAEAGIQVERLDFVERLGHNSSHRKIKDAEVAVSPPSQSEPVSEKIAIPAVLKSSDTAKILFGTLRSGKNVTYPGNVVIVGDVNPGAEIIAEGHIIVMGTLRGVAHAGAAGDMTATITAFRLNPTQLRIGKIITRPPEGMKAPEIPEMARIRDGMIVIEPYS